MRGISPQWDLATTLACAREVEKTLRSEYYADYLAQMYESQPDYWRADLTGIARWRYCVNVFTRMRFCYADGRLDFACKSPIEEAPKELLPWFALDNPLYEQTPIIFGHWASLMGKANRKNIML